MRIELVGTCVVSESGPIRIVLHENCATKNCDTCNCSDYVQADADKVNNCR